MFFTQEDYKKIQKWILANSIKDTEFAGAALPLKGNETVAFVQDGRNVNVFLKDLIRQIFLLGVADFLNVTDKYGESMISLTQAIQLIPYRSRKIGQVITFLDENGDWNIFQFQGERINQWNNTTLWIDLIKKLEGISIIDSEDITATVDNSSQVSLTFADKNYNTADYSGLGRVYLRKNIQRVEHPNTGVLYNTNLLTQQMMTKENTIYILQYDYSLNGQTITIPENCILLFEGGSISNGELVGNNTKLTGDIKILQCVGSGTYNVDKVNVSNFGAKGDGVTDDTQAFNNALSFLPKKTSYVQSPNSTLTLYIPNGIYKIKEVEAINCSIIGESPTGTIIQYVDSDTNGITFIHLQTASYGPKTIISNLYFSSGIFSNRKTSVEFNNCFFGAGSISILQTSDVFIKGCIFDQTADCIKVEQSANISILNNIFFDNALRAVWVISGQNIIISNNNFNSCWGRPILIQSGSQINITGNNFRFKDATINDSAPAFVKLQYTTSPDYDYPFDSISISNNIFECGEKYNAVYINSTKTLSNLVIRNNEIHKAIKGVESIQGTQRLVVTENVFSGSLYHNIWVNTSNVFINNNILIDGGKSFNGDVFQSSIMAQATGAIIINNIQKYTEPSKFKYWLCLNGASNPANFSAVLDNMLQKYDNELYIKDVLAETDYSYMYSNRENMINHINSLVAIGSVTPFKDMKLYVGDSTPLYFNNNEWMNEDGTLLSKVVII